MAALARTAIDRREGWRSKIEGQTSDHLVLRAIRMKEMEAHLVPAGDGCQFGRGSGRESRPEVSTQFCCSGY